MGKKRKRTDSDKEDKILKKIRKLEKKYLKQRSRRRRSSSACSESTSESQQDQVVMLSDDAPSDTAQDTNNLSASIQSDHVPQNTTNTDAIPSTSKENLQSSSTDVINNEEVVDETPIPQEKLQLLGPDPKEKCTIGKNIHPAIACRLENIIQNGLKVEIKDKIKEEHPIPGNCPFFKAPLLNRVVRNAVSSNLVARDVAISNRQDQVGIAITALTKVMDVLAVETSQIDQTSILKYVSDACRLLCDSYHIDTKMRRNFLVSSLNNKLNETLKESKPDKYLFGETLTENIKVNKAITKSSQDLRPTKQKNQYPVNKSTPGPVASTSNLNWRPPQPYSRMQMPQRKQATAPRTAGTTRSSASAGGPPQQPRAESSSSRQPTHSRAQTNTAYYKSQKKN